MTSLRAIFSGSVLKAIVMVIVLLLAIVGGAFALGTLGAPRVVGVENRFGEVTKTTTLIETDLIVNNPNPIGAQLGGATVNYTVTMNEIQMASGTKEGLAINRGNTTLQFTTQMQNEKIPAWWTSHIANDEQTHLQIDARIHSSLVGQTVTVPHSQEINTDIISQFNSAETRPVNANQPIVSDPILYINRTSATWGDTSRSETPIDMQFVVYNPKAVPYSITEIGYEITMNDVRVGEGTTEQSYVIPGGTQETIETTTVIQNSMLDEWWVSHLHKNQITDLRIEFYARIELPTGNTIRIPLDELAYTQRIETDFFGTKEEAGTTGESSPTATPSSEGSDDRGTTTPASNGETATPTADTVIGTPPVLDNETITSPEPTTDDGGLLGHYPLPGRE